MFSPVSCPGDFAVLKRAGFGVPALLAANFLASLTCFAGVALAKSPFCLHHENELVAFTTGTFLALALHSLAPQALDALNECAGGSAKRKAFGGLWCLALVLFIVRFLHFVSYLESSGPEPRGDEL